MREELAQLDGTRWTWVGTFVRFGTKQYRLHRPQTTVLLRDLALVVKHGEIRVDHVWLGGAKELIALDLKRGDRVQFDARIGRYWKRNPDADIDGEPHRAYDFRLSHPTKARKLTDAEAAAELPLFAGLTTVAPRKP